MMNNIYEQFTRVVESQMTTGSKIVLALSGGIDSRVMLDLLARFKAQHCTDIIAVHVNHGISQNAQSWADACLAWCHDVAIPCFIEIIDLGECQGESLENKARQARYQALSKYIECGDVLLTGQHSDDQLETLLLALKRGSGPKGLSSMAESMPFHAGKIVRPLLRVSRKQIEQYAQQSHLRWVEDESNTDTQYERNFIRHHITPLLDSRWPSIRQAVQRSAELCAQQENLLDELLTEKFTQGLDGDGNLLIEPLMSLSDAMRFQLLRMWFQHWQMPMPSQKHITMIWHEIALAGEDSNPQLRLGLIEVRRFAHRLYLVQVGRDVSTWSHPLDYDLPLTLPDNLGQVCFVSDSECGHINTSALNAPLWVSFDPQGLSACPHQRKGAKKLKQLFQEYHIPSWLRRRTPILMCGDKVVCVANLFTDRDFYGEDGAFVWDK